MNYNILNTGSDGNCIIINDIVALDIGIPLKKIEPYLNKLKLVFISHRHSDHLNLSTVRKLHKLRPTIRFCVGEFLYQELIRSGINKNNIDIIKHNQVYDYGMLKVSPFILIHDVFNYGLRLSMNGKKLLYATDTAKINHINAYYYDCYLLEANYDETKLEQNIIQDKENGRFSYGERVKLTHLSIQQSSDFLLKNMGYNSKYEFIHCSKKNL